MRDSSNTFLGLTSSPGGLVQSAREGERVEVRSVQYCEQVVCQVLTESALHASTVG